MSGDIDLLRELLGALLEEIPRPAPGRLMRAIDAAAVRVAEAKGEPASTVAYRASVYMGGGEWDSHAADTPEMLGERFADADPDLSEIRSARMSVVASRGVRADERDRFVAAYDRAAAAARRQRKLDELDDELARLRGNLAALEADLTPEAIARKREQIAALEAVAADVRGSS